jgi:thiamine-phosphate diphosphorylase
VIPALHVVTDDEILGRPEFPSMATRVLREGKGDLALHLRGPGTGGRALFLLAETLHKEACQTGSLVLANDRLDLALAADLPGVHLGQRSIPPEVARNLLGSEKVLGLSVHSVEEAVAGGGEVAVRDGNAVDYFLVGTIFSSPSHPGGATGGVALIEEVRGRTDVPLLAIGGMTPERVTAVLSAGARGLAVRGGIWNSEDPAEATRAFLAELEKG